MTRLGALRLILSLGIVVVLVAWGQPDTRTLAAWTDSVQVSGATLKTAALAPPTSVAVTQACVADPAPVRRSGAGGTSFATGGGSGSLVIPKPSGAVTGDLLVAGITWGGNYLSTFLGPPAGWTLVRKDADNALGQFVYTRFVVAGEPSSYTWTGLSENAAGGIAAYSGVDTSAPVNASSGQVDSVTNSATAPSLTTTRDNVTLVGVFGLLNNVNQSPPGGMTAIWTGFTSGGSPGQTSSMAAEQSWPTAGATGSRTATASGARSVGQLIALQPPARPYATTTWTPSTSGYATGQQFTRSSNAVTQREATLSSGTTSQSDGPLTSGTSYTVAVTTTFNNWTSSTASSSFTGRSC